MGTVGSPMEPVRVTAMASTATPASEDDDDDDNDDESEEGPERKSMSRTPSGLPPGISMPGHQNNTVKRVIFSDILTYRCCHHGRG